MDRLVPVEGARCDERLPAYVTPVRPLARVRPDVRREVGAVAEALLAHGAAVGFLFALLAVVARVVRLEEQRGLLQAAPRAGRRQDEVFDVGFEAVELLLRVVAVPEIPVGLELLLLLHLWGVWVLLIHAGAPVLLAVLRLGRLRRRHCRMELLLGRRRRRWWRRVVMGELLQLDSEASLQPGL